MDRERRRDGDDAERAAEHAQPDLRDPRLSQTIAVPGKPLRPGAVVSPFPPINLTGFPRSTTGYPVYKFLEYDNGPATQDGNFSSAPLILFRYAEVLLSLAEARVRSTNSVDAQALALLNAVRGRSNPTGVYTAASFTSASAMANAILLERRIEFLGEGLRNTDLLRLDATIPGKGTIGPVEPNNVLYVWPIPSTELLTNSLIVRN